MTKPDFDDNKFALGVVVGVVATALIAIGLNKVMKSNGAQEPLTSLMPQDIITAYRQGQKDALSLNPVSLELDQVCLTLWANKLPVREDFK
jgi:hypothetical protein